MGLRFAETAPDAYRYPLLIRQLLQSALDTRTRQKIVGTDDRRHDYPEMGHRVGCLAQVLADLGVAEGDTVAVMDWDSHRYLEAYFAVPMMGAVLQTVNVRLSPDQIAYTLASTGARTLLFHVDFTELVRDLRTRLPDLTVFILMHDGELTAQAHPVDIAGEYEALLVDINVPYAFRDFDEDALATTFHTTGTTGLPKAVAFSHRQLVLHTLALMAHLANQPAGQSFRREDVYMPITPMFHVHAWGIPYVATLLGVKQVYPGRYQPARLIALKENEGVTFSHGVPTIIQMLVEALGTREIDGPWKMVVGGSIFPTALRRAAGACGIDAFAGYGMSETAPVLTMARNAVIMGIDDDDISCRAGHPIPLVQLRTDASNGSELLARAPWLTEAYEGDPAASALLWKDGWLHTQDVAERLDTGDIVIRDRLKDVIKTGGEWVSSAQLEELLTRDPRIAAAAVVGVPDARWGERPLAFVVPRDAVLSIIDIRTHLTPFVADGLISRYAIPDAVTLLADLPKTSIGKIDKKALRVMAAERK